MIDTEGRDGSPWEILAIHRPSYMGIGGKKKWEELVHGPLRNIITVVQIY